MTDRTDVMQRVLNLRELANNNTSEAEAMNAMKVADRMMRSYRIEEAELALAEGLGEIKVEVVDQKRWNGDDGVHLNNGRVRHKVQNCIWTLASYCEVKAVVYHRTTSIGWSRSEKEEGIRIIGDKPDTELFWYLLDLIRNALDNEYARWVRKQSATGRGAKANFQLAMSNRINHRLSEMVYERTKEREETMAAEAKLLNKDADDIRVAVSNRDMAELTTTALVVVAAVEEKRQAVNEAYETAYRGVRLGTARGIGTQSGNSSAASAGRKAGDRVNFSRPVGGSSKKLLR